MAEIRRDDLIAVVNAAAPIKSLALSNDSRARHYFLDTSLDAVIGRTN